MLPTKAAFAAVLLFAQSTEAFSPIGGGYCDDKATSGKDFIELAKASSAEQCMTFAESTSGCAGTISYGKPGGERAKRCLCDKVNSRCTNLDQSNGSDGYDRYSRSGFQGGGSLQYTGDGYCKPHYMELAKASSAEQCMTFAESTSGCAGTISYGKPGGKRAKRCLCDTTSCSDFEVDTHNGSDGFNRYSRSGSQGGGSGCAYGSGDSPTGDKGEFVKCPEGQVVAGICGSGEHRSCGPDGKSMLQIQCKSAPGVSKPDWNWKCTENYGEMLNCPSGMVVTGVCISGKDPACGYPCSSKSSHAIQCAADSCAGSNVSPAPPAFGTGRSAKNGLKGLQFCGGNFGGNVASGVCASEKSPKCGGNGLVGYNQLACAEASSPGTAVFGWQRFGDLKANPQYDIQVGVTNTQGTSMSKSKSSTLSLSSTLKVGSTEIEGVQGSTTLSQSWTTSVTHASSSSQSDSSSCKTTVSCEPHWERSGKVQVWRWTVTPDSWSSSGSTITGGFLCTYATDEFPNAPEPKCFPLGCSSPRAFDNCQECVHGQGAQNLPTLSC